MGLCAFGGGERVLSFDHCAFLSFVSSSYAAIAGGVRPLSAAYV